MHIFEIIEPTITDKQYKGKFNLQTAADSISDPSENEGKYSKVTPNRKDPHTVIKRPRTIVTYLNDPFWEYIKLIKENKLWENPHFPRFYNITTIRDRNGVKMVKLEMEKLIHGSQLNDEQLDYLIDLYFEESVAREVKHSRWGKWVSIVDKLEGFLVLNKDLKHIKDNTLRQAVITLGEIDSEIKMSSGFDIHAKNIMVRNTPYGPQIVFTDPFSD